MIEIKNLHFQYQKKQPLFDDFSLDIQPGSIIGLLGKNGAGKSTLLNLIAGLMMPQKGELLVNGFKSFQRDPNFLADLSMVPEDFSLPPVTIDWYVRAVSPLYPSFDHVKLDKILEEFDLERNSRLNQMSHGQRKKFIIAFTLASNCKLIVLDEPTMGLSLQETRKLIDFVKGIKRAGKSAVFIDHNVFHVYSVADRVIVLDRGTVAGEFLTKDITLNDLTEKMYRVAESGHLD